VLKLYPDAELPRFTVEERSAARMVLLYTSPRKMGHLSEGLILGSAQHYNVEVRVALEMLDVEEGMSTRFVIELV